MLIGIMFMILTINLTYFEFIGKKQIMTSTYNKRLIAAEENIIRGPITTNDGQIIAYTEFRDAQPIRIYPYNNLYSHVIGYHSKIYGKTLLEANYDTTLLSKDLMGSIGKFEQFMKQNELKGNQLVLTIDHGLEQLARDQLGKRAGAIVALNPNTGEVLAMVSTPDFDANANELEANWTDIRTQSNSPFLSRSTTGLYPPGSTFKVLTAITAIENGYGDVIMDDPGSTTIDGKIFKNSKNESYQQLDLSKALSNSSNVYFAELSQLIGAEILLKKAIDSGFSKPIHADFNVTTSQLGKTNMSKTELAATALGQGKTLVTPMQMALLVAGIANDGIIYEPSLIKNIKTPDNLILHTHKPKILETLTDKETANLVTDMMVSVVETGTGQRAKIKGIRIAGKTGTAQNETSQSDHPADHAWFIGFAPAENPQIAIAIILEYSGTSGGESAAPIAKQLINYWLK
jgi:peptidoglycan glycosyltransferase